MAREQSYPMLMIFKEKHDDLTYLVQSAEETHRLAVAKIRERAEIGYYELDTEQLKVERDKAIDKLIVSCGFSIDHAPRTANELAAVEGTAEERAARFLGVESWAFLAYPEQIKENVLLGLSKFETSLPRRVSSYAAEIQDAENIQLILMSEKAEELTFDHRGRILNLALWILDSRRDAQYEGYELIDPLAAPTSEELEKSRTIS